ncbi:hypothetical protein BB561_000634 [Smittium simulii]|uniref:C2H2-type domain-containing protein n=1 Tax=Smittium simulii TaxID=133385 RepID=A0A2T9YYA0_9FUNG|nr:hypothetical protein BB561_000634 [Smittium simulii]
MSQADPRLLLRRAKLKRKLDLESNTKLPTEHRNLKKLPNTRSIQHIPTSVPELSSDILHTYFTKTNDTDYLCNICNTIISGTDTLRLHLNTHTPLNEPEYMKQVPETNTVSSNLPQVNLLPPSNETIPKHSIQPSVSATSVESNLPPDFFDNNSSQNTHKNSIISDELHEKQSIQPQSAQNASNGNIDDIELSLKMLQREVSTLTKNNDLVLNNTTSASSKSVNSQSLDPALQLNNLDIQEISQSERNDFIKQLVAADNLNWSERLNNLKQLRSIVYEINALSQMPENDSENQSLASDHNIADFQPNSKLIKSNSLFSTTESNQTESLLSETPRIDDNAASISFVSPTKYDPDTDTDSDTQIDEDDPEIKNYMMGWIQ